MEFHESSGIVTVDVAVLSTPADEDGVGWTGADGPPPQIRPSHVFSLPPELVPAIRTSLAGAKPQRSPRRAVAPPSVPLQGISPSIQPKQETQAKSHQLATPGDEAWPSSGDAADATAEALQLLPDAGKADDKELEEEDDGDSWADGLEEEPTALPAAAQSGGLAAVMQALAASQPPAEPIDDEDWLAAADEAERSAALDSTGEEGIVQEAEYASVEVERQVSSGFEDSDVADVPVLLINTTSFIQDAPDETEGDHDRALAMVWTVLTGLSLDTTTAKLDESEATHQAQQARIGTASIRIPSPPSLPATDSISFCGRAEELFAEGRAWHSTRLRAGADRTEAERMVPGSEWRVLPYPRHLGQVETARIWAIVGTRSPIQAVDEALLAVRACHKDPMWKMRAVEVLLDMAEEASGAVEARREAIAAEKRGLHARRDALARSEAVEEALQDLEELEAAIKNAASDIESLAPHSSTTASDSDEHVDEAAVAIQSASDTPAARRRHKRRARRFLAGAEAKKKDCQSAIAKAKMALTLATRLAVQASNDARIACRAVTSWPAGGLESVIAESELLDQAAAIQSASGPGLGGVLEAQSLTPWLLAEDVAARGVLQDELLRGGLSSHEAEQTLPQLLGAARTMGAGCLWLFKEEDRQATRRGASQGSAGRARNKESSVTERLLQLSAVDVEECITAIEAALVRVEALSSTIIFGSDVVTQAKTGGGDVGMGVQGLSRPSMSAMSPLTVLLAVVLHRHPQMHPQQGVNPLAPGVPPAGKLQSGEALAASAAAFASSAAAAGTIGASSNAVAYALVQGGGLGPEALQCVEELEQLWRRAFGALPTAKRSKRGDKLMGVKPASAAGAASASGMGDTDDSEALNWDALPSIGLRWSHLEEEQDDDYDDNGSGSASVTRSGPAAASAFDWESLANTVSSGSGAETRAEGSSRHSKPASMAKAPSGGLAAKLAAATQAAIDNA